MPHSILAPSAAHIWGKPDGCTGYVLMAQVSPDVEGPEAVEGSRFHDFVKGLIDGEGFYPDWSAVPSEIIQAADLCVDDVNSVLEKHPLSSNDVVFGTEVKLAIPSIHGYCFGTLDCFLYDRATRELFIWDFKFGYGVVEVFENWQMICYAAGLFDELPIDGHEDQRTTVHFRIIQPRAFHRDGPIREWSVPAWKLREEIHELRKNAAIALGNDSITRSGNHCRYCPARHSCRAALDAGIGFYELATTPTPLDLSPEAVGTQLAIVQRAHDQLGYVRTGLEEQATSLIRSGENVPGFILESGAGRETWTESPETVKALGEMCGVDLDKHALVTPNQARELGVDKDMVALYAERPSRGMKLVADDGTRAREIFSGKEL